jgi:hypothetical protein
MLFMQKTDKEEEQKVLSEKRQKARVFTQTK